MTFPRENKRPPPEMYELARRKLGSHQDVLNWFFACPNGSVCPQSLLNIDADFLVMEMLEKLPDRNG